jgi:hypothetical protein
MAEQSVTMQLQAVRLPAPSADAGEEASGAPTEALEAPQPARTPEAGETATPAAEPGWAAVPSADEADAAGPTTGAEAEVTGPEPAAGAAGPEPARAAPPPRPAAPPRPPERVGRRKGPPERPLRPGEVIAGRWQVVTAAGGSAFGMHYHVREKGQGQLLSLWTARAPDAAAEAVLATGSALQRIDHRNVARTLGVLRDGERVLVLTEHVEGESLEEHLSRRAQAGGLPLRSAVNVVLQLAAALSSAHAVSAHGALGLDAVFVLPSGRLKISGFGLGLLAGGDRLSDLRAVGAMLFELLTGAEWSPEAPPAARVRGDLPPAVDAVLKRALTGGFGMASELHDALAAAVGARALGPPAGAPAAMPEPRYMVVKGHLDYGPYSLPQLMREISEGRLKGDATLKNVTTGARRPLAEFPELAEMLREVERRMAAEKARAAAEDRKRRIQRGRRVRAMVSVLLVLAVAAGVTVFLMSRMETPEVVRHIPRFHVVPSRGEQAQVTVPVETAERDEPSRARRRRRRAPAEASPGSPGATTAQAPASGSPSPAVPVLPPEPPPPPAEVDFSDNDPTKVAAREEAKETARRSSARLRPCFDQEVRRVPGLRGRFTVSFSVSNAGRVYGARVQGGPVSPALDACVRATVATFSFPQFSGLPLQVEYPFTISTE